MTQQPPHIPHPTQTTPRARSQSLWILLAVAAGIFLGWLGRGLFEMIF